MNRQTSTALAAYLSMSMMAEAVQNTTQTQQPEQPPLPPGSKQFTFNFRTEAIRDETGKEIGKGTKNPPVNAILPVPTDADLIDFIAAGGKEAEAIRDAVSAMIEAAARGQINDFRAEPTNKGKTVTADVLDLSKLTFTAIALTPKADRAAPEIPEEQYNSFFEDYKSVMVAAGKDPDRVKNHIPLYKSQFRTCKFDKPALGVLRDSLNLYAARTENMEDNAAVYEVLSNKLDKYLKAEEKNLVGAL